MFQGGAQWDEPAASAHSAGESLIAQPRRRGCSAGCGLRDTPLPYGFPVWQTDDQNALLGGAIQLYKAFSMFENLTTCAQEKKSETGEGRRDGGSPGRLPPARSSAPPGHGRSPSHRAGLSPCGSCRVLLGTSALLPSKVPQCHTAGPKNQVAPQLKKQALSQS